MKSTQTTGSTTAPGTRFGVQIVVFTLVRLVLHIGHRMVYPFLPTFARGLGVDLQTVALAVTARSGLGLISPLFGGLADLRGRKIAMLAGMVLFVAGMALVMLWPTYPALFAGLLLAGIAKLIYDPAMQAYIGDRVRYEQRGQAMALAELSWSGAFLLGMPLVGWLIARTGVWHAAFPMLALLGALAVGLIWRVIPSDAVREGMRLSLADGARLVLRHQAARAGLVVSFLISGANEVLTIIYGAWLEDDFGLAVTGLGASAIAIGLAELAGEGAVAGFVDRIGKRRAVAMGIGFNTLVAPLLLLAGGMEVALLALFLFYLSFEFGLVSSLPLMSELVPDARATLMAGIAAAFASGRMVGALIGAPLFAVGLWANVGLVSVLNVLALVVLLLYIRQA